MIFVDTNVFMYAVGRRHPLRLPAREFLQESMLQGLRLCTSAEVLQELLHAYLPVGRLATCDNALALIDRMGVEVWPLQAADVVAARELTASFAALGARDLCHLASCRRRGVRAVKSFDQALSAAFG